MVTTLYSAVLEHVPALALSTGANAPGSRLAVLLAGLIVLSALLPMVMAAEELLPQPAKITDDMRVAMDVPYVTGLRSDPSTRQALDIYAPRKGTHLPVIAYVHGGGWRYWDRKGVYLKPAAFIAQGYVFVSIGYRLVPEVRYREQCSDVAQGLRWVRDHIAEYGGSPDHVHLMGFSAGAPMVTLTISDPQYLKGAGVPLSAIHTVTALDGDCYKIPKQMEMVEPRIREYLESVWGNDPKGWDDPSPITHLAPGRTYPPLLLVYRTNGADVTWQAKAFADRYREVGGTVQMLGVDMTHLSLNAAVGREGHEITKAFYGFVKKYDGEQSR